MTARPAAPEIRTFLIADIRGYTAFSQRHGDEAAARLASSFAEIVREGVEAYGGEVIELRGDEALAVFSSARQALRAAVELQLVFVDEMRIRPALPLRVGMGLDAGEAVPVEGGFRGGALNLAARLCSTAAPGVVLASQGVIHLARAVPGLRFKEEGPQELKGLAEPVSVVRVRPETDTGDPARRLAEIEASATSATVSPTVVPDALGAVTPLVGRARETRRLRWMWREARLQPGGLALIAGAEGMGKTRLVAEAAALASFDGALVSYVSCRDTPGAVRDALAEAREVSTPGLLVVDDLDAATPADAGALAEAKPDLDGRAFLVLGALDDTRAPALAGLVGGVAESGRLVRLGPLDAAGVSEIAASYGLDAGELPVDRILADSDGRPVRVHRAVAEWIREAATRRLADSVSRTAVGWSDLREHEDELARNVVDLQLARERLQTFDIAVGTAAECPYMGLASFDVDDAELFYGRERLVAELVTRLARTTLVGVVGPSGSGKSSAVRAGLVPTVAAGALPGSADWTRILLRPGAYPLRELDRAVWASLPERHRSTLAGAELPLRAVRELLETDERILLVVDQFEEAYTLCGDEAERDAFVKALVEAAREPDGRISVVLAIRADYYGRCAGDPELAALLGANHVLVGPMSAEEYRRAIEQPAQRVGLRVDAQLVDALVADVVDEPGALPLLSTALVELWHRREGGTIPMRAYLDTGGVSGAVARLAEEAYASLSERQRDIARSVMLRLTGSGDADAVVRRRAPLSEFDTEDADLAHVLEVLTDDRLVTLSEGSIEVAHEALLREWPRLRNWVDEDREGRRLREHLIVAARDWKAAGRDPGELYRGARLGAALDWTADHALELNELERSFLAESRAASEEEADRQRRTNRRLRGLLIGAGVLLVVAVAAGAVALVARNDAQDSATSATAQRLGADAQVVKDVDLSLLLARQAVELDESPETLANLEASLVRAPDAIRFVRPLPGRLLGPAVVSDDGKLVSVGNNGGQVAFLDAFTGRVLRTAKADGAGFFPGGHRAWIGRGFPVVELAALDLQSGKETPIAKVEAPETAAAFSISQDLETWATLDESGRLELRDVHSNRVLQTETIPGGRVPVDVRFQGPHLAVLSGDPELGFGGPLFVDVWRVDPWAKRGSIEDPGPGVAVAVDPSGSSVVVGRDDGSLAVHDLRAGSSRLLSGRHSSRVNDASYSRDGKLIGSAGDDGQAIVWDAATGEPLHILEAHSAKIFGPAFDPTGKTVYTDGLDGALVAWDLTGSRLLGRSFSMRPVDPPGSVPDFYRDETNSYSAASPDGRRLAVVEDATKLAVYDLASGGRLFATPAQKEPVTAVTWSPDGREIATGTIGGELRIWSARDGSPVDRTFAGTPAAFPPGLDVPPDATNDLHAIAYSPDGARIAAALSDGRVLVWDAATGKPSRAPLDDGRQGGSALDLAWSPDGGMLAAALGRPGEGIVWRMPEGKELYRVNIDDGYGRGSAVAFSPDGGLLATGGGSGEIKLWDARTGAQSGASLTGTSGWVLSLGFDPTSSRAVSTGTDGVARLWDIARRAPFGAPLPGIGGEDGSLADILSDGLHLVVASPTGRAWVWPLEADVWKDRACAVAGRTLTEREWELYLPGEPYEPACAD